MLHQFERADGLPGGSDQVDIGGDAGGLSLDAAYAHISDAVSAASLTTAQAAAGAGDPGRVHLEDNTVWTLQGKYAWKGRQASSRAGYERIRPGQPGAADRQRRRHHRRVPARAW